MSRRNLIWVALMLVLASAALFLTRRKEPTVAPTDPAIRQLSGAIEAYKLLNKHGYTPLPPGRATQGAIEGMVGQVDESSAYIRPDQADHFAMRSSGELLETGLRIERRAGRIVVVGPLPGSPAHQGGLFAGMEIRSVNGVPAADMTLAQARKILAQRSDQAIELQLLDRQANEITRTLRAARFELETVTGIARDDQGQWFHALDEEQGIYYVRVSEFVRRTPGELRSAYRRLADPAGLVLDLRGNPGGDRSAGIAVADRFIETGLIGRIESRNGQRHSYYAHADGTFPLVPTIVLVDGATASAAEIVAGALQAHGRAVLLGEESYGKWSVQSTVDLGGGLGVVHLTTGRFNLAPPTWRLPAAATAPATLPAATQVTAQGASDGPLQPDVPVALTGRAAAQLARMRMRVEVMPPPATTTTTRPSRTDRARKFRQALLRTDSQLAKALELLRQQRVPTTRPAGQPPLTTQRATPSRTSARE